MPSPRIYLGGGGSVVAGSQTLFGAGVPAGGLGNVGDVYYNTTAKNIYKKTGALTWTLQTSYQGMSVYFGVVVPPGATGLIGDVYFDTAAKNIYQKTGALTWTLETNYSGGSLTVKNEGTLVQAGVSVMDFKGVDIDALLSGGEVKVYVPPLVPPTPPSIASGGYFSGGTLTPTSGNTQTTCRLDFANDSTNMVNVGVLNSTPSDGVSGFNSAVNGYFAPSPQVSGGTVRRLVFASDTTNMGAACAFANRNYHAAVNSALYGYLVGGQGATSVPVNTNERVDFANDTAAPLARGVLSVNRAYLAGAGSSTKGYFAGGQSGGGVYPTISDRLVYATDTLAMTSGGALAVARTVLAGANSTTAAYFTGGLGQPGSTPYLSSTSRLVFATDTSAMNTAGVLTLARMGLAGANSTLAAYFAGGSGGVVAEKICDKLLFSSDTSAMTSAGELTETKYALGACQSGGIL